MSDQPSPQTSRIADPIPLLPRGELLFEAIPLRAVVMEALAPALSHGCLVVRDRDRGAVVLVRDGALVEVHAFSGATARTGEGVLAEVQGWSEAVVTAHRLDPLLVDVCEALLRGEIIYSDLRLDWVEWPNLLADFSRRGGAYAVEIFTPGGRGVTCVAVGQQALSYTDIHPVPRRPRAPRGDGRQPRRQHPRAPPQRRLVRRHRDGHRGQPAASAPARPGRACHRRQPHGAGNAATARRAASPVPAPRPQAAQETRRPRRQDTVRSRRDGAARTVDDALPDLTWVAPWQTPWRDEPAPGGSSSASLAGRPTSTAARPSVGDMLGDLRGIAQRRLQLSASRVETVLDEAAREQRALDSVLEEIRSMSIRGVMPSTVDAMVAEMKIAAAEYRST